MVKGTSYDAPCYVATKMFALTWGGGEWWGLTKKIVVARMFYDVWCTCKDPSQWNTVHVTVAARCRKMG